MATVSTSFSAATQDLAGWIRQLVDAKVETGPSAATATGAQILLCPVALNAPTQDRTGKGILRGATAHICVSFGPKLPDGGSEAYDTVFFEVLRSDGVAFSGLEPASAHWTAPPGLFLLLERRIEKPLDHSVARPVAEPLVFTITDTTHPKSAEGA